MSKNVIIERSISSQCALEACRFAIQKASELDIRINVSVVDNKGLEMAFVRMENAFIHSIDIAKDKAYTSASFGFDTKQWTEIFKTSPHFEQGFNARDRLITIGGGCPIFDDTHTKIGAIGVSGGTEEEDITCAKYAIMQIGFE